MELNRSHIANINMQTLDAKPPLLSHKHKCEGSHMPIKVEEARPRHRQTGAEAIYAMSAAIQGLTSALAPPQGSTTQSESAVPAPATPEQQKTQAIRVAEEEEEGRSDLDLVNIVELFENSVQAANTYLAFSKNKRARTLWLDRQLLKANHKQASEKL
jgi:hypothetical protein